MTLGTDTGSAADEADTGPSALPASGPDRPTARRHTARWLAIGVLVVAAGLVAVLATRPPASVSEVYSPLVGRQAPPISGTTVAGAPFALPARPGRFVVVNFFASWCTPCRTEGPGLVPLPVRTPPHR